MQYRILESDDVVTLALSDQVVVTDRSDFEQAVEETLERKPRKVAVVLDNLEYMDSAGLGLLLMLRDAATHNGTKVVLKGAAGQVQELFETANFKLLFETE